MSRYFKKEVVKNDLDFYSDLLENRDLNVIYHHRQTQDLGLTPEFVKNLRFKQTTWTISTKLHKLSYEYYGTTELWWVIGLVNTKPTDIHWKPGDIVYIPTNPEEIIKRVRQNG